MGEIRSGGIWRIQDEDDNFNGELFIDEGKGIIRLIIYYEDQHDIWGNKHFSKIIPLINGSLITGAKITLIDCEVLQRHSQNLRYNTIIIGAHYAIDGMNFTNSSQASFDKIYYTLSNIITWAGLCKYDSNFDGDKEAIVWSKENIVSFKINDETDILFYPYRGSQPYQPYSRSMTLTQYVGIEFTYSKGHTLSQSIEDIQPIIDLISFATNQNISIEKMECCNEQTSYYIQDRKMQNPRKVFLSKAQNLENEPSYLDILFYLNELTNNGNEYLTNWFNKYEKLKPIMNLYTAAFKYPEIPIEMHFLNVVQALETYHSRFICDKLKQYKKRIENILSEVPEEIRNYHLKFLLSDAQEQADYIILKSRLNDLMLAEFKIVFYNMSREAFPYKFIDKVVDTRHYFTHYSKSKEVKALSGIELIVSCRILRVMLEYYLLKEIGFNQEYINSKIRNRQKYIADYYDEIELSKYKIYDT